MPANARGARTAIAAGLVCSLGCGVVSAQEAERNRPPQDDRPVAPVDSGLVEEQVVALAEVRILVTDREGNAVTDLEPGDVRVLEDGGEQRLAFLETVSGGRELPIGASTVTSVPPGQTPASEVEPVLPAKAVRRIVIAFDVRGSSKSVRQRWREAARSWLSDGVRPGDRVGLVLLGDYPEWIAGLTENRTELRTALEEVSLEDAASGRDRGRDMTLLMAEIRDCLEGDLSDPSRKGGVGCMYNVARGTVHRWNAEAEETVRGLRSLVGQLAAIPGRKAVLLFSDGIVEDASMAAVNAMVAGIGSADYNLDVHKIKTRLGRDVRRDVEELLRTARAGDVTLFTLDTDRGDDTGFTGNVEHSGALAAIALGLDPWRELDEAMRRTLDTLARDSGGRSYRGVRELTDHVRAAADGFFGMYTVGYYRSDPKTTARKVRVEIDRPKVTVTYTDRAEPPGGRNAKEARLELVIGKPHPRDGEERLVLPIAARVSFEDLPLREGDIGVGTVLGIYFRAVRPDGTVVAERLDVEAVGIANDRLAEAEGKKLIHRAELVLPPGSYRVLARISDDRQLFLATRAVDLTVAPDGVRPGLAGPPPG